MDHETAVSESQGYRRSGPGAWSGRVEVED